MVTVPQSLQRVVVLDVGARRRVARERLTALPPAEAAPLWASFARWARRSTTDEREAATWVGLAVLAERRADTTWWRAFAAAAAASADPLERALVCDGPVVRGLLPRGRLPDVAVRAPSAAVLRLQQQLWRWSRATTAEPTTGEPPAAPAPLGRFLVDRVSEGALRHAGVAANVALVEALLREPRRPWRALIDIATRRPTSEGIALALLCDDLAIARPALRTALAENPSVPTALRLALLPSVSEESLRRLAGGYAHQVQQLAALLTAPAPRG